MYKFTNGVVVFDEKTRDDFIKAGYRLVKEENTEKPKEVNLDENSSNNGTIEEKSRRSKKVSK